MSWNPVNDLKKAYKKLRNEIESTANSAKNSVNWVKDQAKKEIYKVKDDCKKWVQNAGETVKDNVEKEIKEVGDGIKHEFEGIKGEIEDKANDVKSLAEDVKGEIEDKANDVKSLAEDAKEEIEKLPETVKEEVINAFEDLAEAGLAEVAKKGLQAVKATKSKLGNLRESKPDLVDSIDALGFDLEIGPMTLSYSNFYNRSELLADALERQSKNPTSFHRKPLLEFIEAIGPDSVDLGISVNIAALVVSSDSLGVGLKFKEVQLKLFLELGDIILKELGVPE